MSDASPLPHLNDAQREAAKRVILFTVFLDILGFGIIFPQLPVYATHFGADAFKATLLAATYSAAGFVFTPIWGRLSDRIGRRPVLLYSILGTAAGYMFFAYAHSLLFLFLARLIDGITAGNISTAQAYLSDITEPKDRARNFGIFGAIFGVGFAFGPTVGAAISHLPGIWGTNFGLGLFSALLSLLNWALALKNLPETLSPAICEENARRDVENPRPLFNVQGFQRALQMPRLNLVIVIGFLATAAFSTIQGTYSLFIITRYVRPAIQREIKSDPRAAAQNALKLHAAESGRSPVAPISGGEGVSTGNEDDSQPYAASMGGAFDLPGQKAPTGISWIQVEKLLVRPLAVQWVSHIFVIIGFLSLLIQGGLVRPLQKRVGEVSLVISGTLIMAFALMAIALPREFWGQYVVAGFLTLGNGLSTPVLTALVSQLTPEAERGEITGVFQSIQSLGRVIGPPVGGFFFGRISPGAPFIFGGVAMLSAFALAFKLRGALGPREEAELMQKDESRAAGA